MKRQDGPSHNDRAGLERTHCNTSRRTPGTENSDVKRVNDCPLPNGEKFENWFSNSVSAILNAEGL